MDTKRELSGRIIKTEEDLDIDGKIRDHDRKHMIRTHMNNVVIIFIYALPGVFFILFLSIVIHDWIINDWKNIEQYMYILGGGIFGYVVRVLQDSGIHNE